MMDAHHGNGFAGAFLDEDGMAEVLVLLLLHVYSWRTAGTKLPALAPYLNSAAHGLRPVKPASCTYCMQTELMQSACFAGAYAAASSGQACASGGLSLCESPGEPSNLSAWRVRQYADNRVMRQPRWHF